MALLLTTSQATDSANFVPPNAEVFVQFEAASPDTVVTVLGKVHADATYTPMYRWLGGSSGMIRLASVPLMRVEVSKNVGQARVWNNA